MSLFVEYVPWISRSNPLTKCLVAFKSYAGIFLTVWSDVNVVITRHVREHWFAKLPKKIVTTPFL